MIIEFSVQNFGSIKNKVTLSFEASKAKNLENYYVVEPIKGLRLLKLGLIYGANGSGKTTILNALDFLSDLVLEPLKRKTDHLNFEPFLFDNETPHSNSIFKLIFLQNEVKYDYEIEFNKKSIAREILYFFNPNKAILFERTTDLTNQISRIKFGDKAKINKKINNAIEVNTLMNNSVLGAFSKLNIDSAVLLNVFSWFTERSHPIVKVDSELEGFISDKIDKELINKKYALMILQKADFQISDINIKTTEKKMDKIFKDLVAVLVDNNPEKKNVFQKQIDEDKYEIQEVYFQHSINNGADKFELPYKLESQGTQRYYQFSGLLALLIQKNTMFLIDEIESSLHPDLLRHFLLTFLTNSNSSQLIATTHYRELLMDKDIFRNDAIWFTEKKEDGSTDLFSLDDFDSSVIRDTSSVYNAYKIGKLGAVPSLSDYFIDFEDGTN